SDADVPVEAAALGEVVDGDAGTEGSAAVVAAGADRRRDALRAVVDGVRPAGDCRLRGRISAAAQGLVIGTGGRAAPFGRDPGVAVVLGIGGRAARAVELRFEDPPELAVRPEDGIERNAREGRAHVGPGRLASGVEDRAQRVVPGL